MYTRLGTTSVSQGHTGLRSGMRPFDKRFKFITRVFSMSLQVMVLTCSMRHTSHRNRFSATTTTRGCHAPHQFPTSSDSISPLCVRVEAQFTSSPSSAPWPKGSSSSLHLSVTADGGWLVGPSTYRSSCRATIAEHVVGSCFHGWRLSALPHLAHRKISNLPHLLLIACLADTRVPSNSFLFCCLVFLWTGVRGGKNPWVGNTAYRLNCLGLAWLAISSAHVSRSVEQPISTSFAVSWLLHTCGTKMQHCGLLSGVWGFSKRTLAVTTWVLWFQASVKCVGCPTSTLKSTAIHKKSHAPPAEKHTVKICTSAVETADQYPSLGTSREDVHKGGTTPKRVDLRHVNPGPLITCLTRLQVRRLVLLTDAAPWQNGLRRKRSSANGTNN